MKATSTLKTLLKRIIIIIPIILAIIITTTLVRSAKGPERTKVQEQARTVRAIQAQAIDVVPRVIGYGYVEPGQVWRAVAEVSGKVIEASPALKKGSLAREGEILLRIDPSKYDLAIAQKEASIESIKAQLAELDVTEKNLKTSLEIEKKTLELSQKELDRQKQLLENKTIARSVYDKQQQAYYAQLSKIQNLQNSLNLLPANRKALSANLKLNQVSLKDAKLDRENTEITVPFDCRFTEVNVEISQFVQRGQVVAIADGLKTSEIRAQIPTGKMRNFISTSNENFTMADFDIKKFTETFELSARVRFRTGLASIEWEARLAGVDASMDPQARTLSIIVAVDEPYEKIEVGARPPLVRNMFCEVELSSKAIPETIVIPRSALHGETVYVVDADNRLVRKKVTIDFAQANFYVIKDGLNIGDTIIVSDLIPAIEGMLLEPTEDQELMTNLIAEATGKVELK